MTKDGPDLYFDEKFMKQPNHTRVVRMLHEMQLVPHEDRRHADLPHDQEQRAGEPSSLTDLQDSGPSNK